jgi:hypothetical protein
MTRVDFTWDPMCASMQASAAAAHRIGLARVAPSLDDIYRLGLLNEVLKEKDLPPVQELTP